MLMAASLVSCLAPTREAQLRWRTEMETKLAPGAVGPGYRWTDRNAYDGRINIWRWPVEPGTGRVYLYVRNLETCGTDPRTSSVLIAPWGGPDDPHEIDARSTGLALDLPPRVWFVFIDKKGHEFEVRDGESLLLLVEPWREPRRDAGPDGHDVMESREQRNREIAAQRCRHRNEIGQPWSEVPTWSGD